jgi:hypothetical protein
MVSVPLLAGAPPQGVAATNVLGDGSALESVFGGACGVSASIRMGKLSGPAACQTHKIKAFGINYRVVRVHKKSNIEL